MQVDSSTHTTYYPAQIRNFAPKIEISKWKNITFADSKLRTGKLGPAGPSASPQEKKSDSRQVLRLRLRTGVVSSVGLERLLDRQEVTGSNPVQPTHWKSVSYISNLLTCFFIGVRFSVYFSPFPYILPCLISVFIFDVLQTFTILSKRKDIQIVTGNNSCCPI